MKTYIVKRLEVGDDFCETHGLRLTHGVYADDDVLRSAVALCYNEPTAELLRDLLADFERECCGMGDENDLPFSQDDARINELEMWRGNRPGG